MSDESSLVEPKVKHFIPWSFSEEHQLVHFVVQYNEGKEHWELRYDVIIKYIAHLRESKHPVTRTANAMFERLKVLRRVIRDDIGSDKYGIDTSARYKLASRITREAVKRDKNGEIKRPPTRSEPRASSSTSDQKTGQATTTIFPILPRSKGKRQRAASPYPGKDSRIRLVQASNMPSVGESSDITEPRDHTAVSTQKCSPTPRLTGADDDDLDKSSITVANDGHTSFDESWAGQDESIGLDPPANHPPSREPVHAAPALNCMAPVPKASPVRGSQADEGTVAGGPVMPPKQSVDPGSGAPNRREDARHLPWGRVSAVVTLDGVPVIKKERVGRPDEVRTGAAKRKDAAIIKELARMPNMTLNKAFVMYYDNIEVYQELYHELIEE